MISTVKLIATFVAIFATSAILLLLGNILAQNLLG
jgi:hypothetical protein